MRSDNRRNFLKMFSTTVAGSVLLPFSLNSKVYSRGQLPQLETPPDEKYWEMVKKQFAVPDDLLMVNSANLCPTPFVVNERVRQFTMELQRNVSFQNRAQFIEIRKKAILDLAAYLGISDKEVGITRNTTEGNNIVVNGLDLKSGDEVILWNQNHPSNRESWENRSRRIGFKVKRISVPVNPKSKEDLIQPFSQAITSKTRVISFSHISNVSGIALPAKEICDVARGKGIYTLIDGAQALGFLDLNISDIGCDFYTASAHKWLMGPLENGILFIKYDQLSKIWPDRITVGWKTAGESVDQMLCGLGQRNDSTTPAMIDIISFHQNIGKGNLEQRIRDLNAHLKREIKSKIQGVQFITPMNNEFSGGVTIFKIPERDPMKLFTSLYEKHGIACAPTGGVRLSPTICTTMKDMDRIVAALVEESGNS